MPDEQLRIAVFIDFDNVEIGVKSTMSKEFDVAAVLEALKESCIVLVVFSIPFILSTAL